MEKTELKLNLTPETTELFRTAYYNSGCKSYEEFTLQCLKALADKKTEPEQPAEETEAAPEPEQPALKKFQLLVTDNAANSMPIIEAESPEAAKKELKKRLPHATIHIIKAL